MDPPYQLIRDRLASGKVVPFLGSGASLGGRLPGQAWESPEASDFLPTSTELAAYLEKLSGFPSGESNELTRVAQYFSGIAGPDGLYDELRKVFRSRYAPTRLHRYLAGFDGLLMITTNYDDLLERAFEEAGRPFVLVVYRTGEPRVLLRRPGDSEFSEAIPNELDVEVGKTPIVFKMHGMPDAEDSARDSFVITEEDYVEFLARMSSRTAIPAVFAEPLQKSHFLFLGYGLRDWNLRVVLYRIYTEWRSRRGYASWAVQYQADALEKQFWSTRMLTIFELGIDEFLDGIEAPVP